MQPLGACTAFRPARCGVCRRHRPIQRPLTSVHMLTGVVAAAGMAAAEWRAGGTGLGGHRGWGWRGRLGVLLARGGGFVRWRRRSDGPPRSIIGHHPTTMRRPSGLLPRALPGYAAPGY